jgi:sarcosine oxidase subunit alpha
VALRILRLTSSGELAFEIFTPTHDGLRVWEHVLASGQPWQMRPYGLEALGSLRIEKGHVVGSEMDGRTTLDDLGAGRMASKTKGFWGGALRHSPQLARSEPAPPWSVWRQWTSANRRTTVPFCSLQATQSRATGLGHVASTTFSKTVGKAVALGLLQGRDRPCGRGSHRRLTGNGPPVPPAGGGTLLLSTRKERATGV